MVKYTHQNTKDNDGNHTPYSDDTESRRWVRADAEDMGALLPESVLSTRKQVIRHGSLRYKAKPSLVGAFE